MIAPAKQNKLEQLFKANPIKGRFCQLHHVATSDAQFIYDLRTSRGQHLKPIGETVAEQKAYLRSYHGRFAKREEIYFKIFDIKNGSFTGVTRLTMLQDHESFNFESGVMDKNANPNVYLDAMFMCYRIGFDFLGKKSSGPWTVDKGNTRMIQLHKLVNIGKVTGEKGQFCVLHAKKADYHNRCGGFLKMGFGKLGGLL